MRLADWLRVESSGPKKSRFLIVYECCPTLSLQRQQKQNKTKQQQQQQQQQQQMWSENHSGCAQEFGIRGQTNYLNFIS